MRRMLGLVLPLLLMTAQLAAGQATGTITGVVTGENGQPLVGAIVGVAGLNLGATTVAGGRYTITGVPAGARTVQANYVGYTQRTSAVTVAAGATATLNLALSTEAVVLEGLVAVGYGVQRRQDVTGALATVEMAGMENRVIRGATEALIGQVAGVRVVTSSGAPGSGGQIQIRGLSAVGAGSTPLYVIDGFPITAESATGANAFTVRSPLADIPPSEIESITVLKDASATAIYGSQASNGVVLITTKRGRAVAPRVDINIRSGIQTPMWDRLPKLANGTEFATYMNRRNRQLLWVADGCDTCPIPGRDDPRIEDRWKNPESYGEGTNWFREIIHPTPTNEITASVNGGTERVRVALSSGLLRQEGLLDGSAFNRGNLRANLDADIGSRMKVQLSLAPTYTVRTILEEGGTGRGGSFGGALTAWPTDVTHLPDGSVKPFIWGSTGGETQRNPLLPLDDTQIDDNSFNTLFNTAVDYELLEGVTLRSQFNARMSNDNRSVYTPSTIVNAAGDPVNPSMTTTHGTGSSWLTENTLNFNRVFRDAHSVQVLLGGSAQKSVSEGTNVDKNAGSFFLPDDIIRQIDIASGGSTSWSSWTMMSAFGRLNYTLLDRYVLTATVRRDGSSRFGQDNRWGTFPSGAVSWNVSQEPFMQNVMWLNDLKLRASLGYTGNSQIGNFSSFGNVAQGNYNFGLGNSIGRGINTLSNPSLGWERTREVNLGMDVSLLDRRVDFAVDAYRRVTQDLLISRDLPAASGFGSVTSNLGSIQNQGLELQLTTRNIDGPRFSWTTNANVAFNRNKALNLGESDTLFSGGSLEGAPTHRTVVGHPIGMFVGYRIIGIYSREDMQNVCTAGAPTPGCVAIYDGAVASDVKFKDVNGDGVIRQVEDFEVLGNPWPKMVWGLTNSLSYGPFLVRSTMDGQLGGMVTNRNLGTIENIDGPFNVSRKYVQGMFIDWDSIGDGMTPAAGTSSTGGRRAFRDVHQRWVQDAAFIWIRNIQVNYELPSAVTNLVNGRNAGVYVSLENPWLSTKCDCNPQTQRNTGNPNLQPGFDDLSYPLARFWVVGLNLGL